METGIEQGLRSPQLQSNTNHIDNQQHSLSDEDQKINSPISAHSMESNSSHSKHTLHTEMSPVSPPNSSPTPPPRPPREGATLNEAYRRNSSTMHDSFKFKRESSMQHRTQIPPKQTIANFNEPTAMDSDEKTELLREIKTRDAIISEMKKKEQWWRTEVSVARHLQQEQGNVFQNDENISLLTFKQDDKLALFQQLVTVKAEIKKIRNSINKQNDPILEKIEQAENTRSVALEEAAYYKAKYTALKSRNNGALDLLESDRIEILEKRLMFAYEEKDNINCKLQKISLQSQHDQSARLLAEERAKDAQRQSEQAQEAHQNALEELTELYEQIIKLEAQGRDDAIQIADLSNKLANQLSLENSKTQDNSQLHIEFGRLEAANIKSRNEIAVLLKRLEESKDDENNLKMLLSDKDQAYAEAVLELEKTCIELDLLKNMSNSQQTSLTIVK